MPNFPISTFILANYEQVIDSQDRKLITWCLEKKDFQNMIGRAGRAVYDTEGQIVFMVPSQPITRGVTWQDYLFPRPDDSERLILSSLNREDFRRSILEQILSAMEHPTAAEDALSIDPETLNSHYGPGAREVGQTILRLQAFLLALMDREVLDPENIETIFRFFRRTLFGQQQPDDTLLELVTRFTQKTGQLMITAESDGQKRGVYGKIGLGFTSCKSLYRKASDFWADYGQKMFDKEVEHITDDFLDDIGSFAFSLFEVRPEAVKIPHTRPTKYLTIPHGEVIGRWIISLSSLVDVRDDYFKEIPELGERTEACANYIRDAFEYKGPWILSAFCLFVSNIAQTEGGVEEFENTPLGRQLSMLPAYSKFGVNNPASAFFSMIGVSIRDVSTLLGAYYNQENSDRYFDFSRMFDWVLALEPEQVTEWFNKEYGEDTAGQVSRLFRLLDSLRRREQSLEEVLPLEITIAGWQYYHGTKALPQMTVGEEVRLRPDPLNPWDVYAVEIFDNQGTKLGFVPKAFSQAVYNHLASEIPLKATIASIDLKAKYHPVKVMLDALEA
jgi:hypothetical protein